MDDDDGFSEQAFDGLSEQDLCNLVRNSTHDTWGSVHRKLAPESVIASICRGLGVGANDVAATVNGVMIKAFNARAGLQATTAAGYRAWIRVIAYHLIIEEVRRDGRRCDHPGLLGDEYLTDCGEAIADPAARAVLSMLVELDWGHSPAEKREFEHYLRSDKPVDTPARRKALDRAFKRVRAGVGAMRLF